jgi:hypothetical protein
MVYIPNGPNGGLYGHAYGGGADFSTLNGCKIIGNVATNNTPESFGGGVENSTLNCCSLIGNSAGSGGGADSSMLSNCVLSLNLAIGGGGGVGSFGGPNASTVYNSLLYANTAYDGGGAAGGTLVNCTVLSNQAVVFIGYTNSGNYGGGVFQATVKNSIIYYNTISGTNGPNCYGGTGIYSCTTPLPSNGVGNITSPPQFINLAGGNFRLQTNSPCIDAGNNGYATGLADLDGRPRIVGGTVDMGAYEFQGPGMGEFIGWLQQYGLPTDGTADYVDSDQDGLNNYQEWIAGTNPTNALSVLAMLNPVPTNNPPGLFLSWQSVNNRTYFLQSSTNLGAQPAFSTIQSNIVGQAGTTGYMDTNAVGNSPYFYRVGVQ